MEENLTGEVFIPALAISTYTDKQHKKRKTEIPGLHYYHKMNPYMQPLIQKGCS